MSRLSQEVREQVNVLVRENANNLKDKDLVELVRQNLNVSVSLGLVRKARKDLGIVKSPGRGVCRVVVESASSQEQS